ncbi:MAG: carboxyl-terminal processing protease [Chlorobiota bacterium]|nr:MAG: S41 family peptidase [Chlorobiota bacterium]
MFTKLKKYKLLRKKELFIVTISVAMSLGFYSAFGDIYFEIGKNIDIFSRVYKEITLNYVDEINPEEFIRAGIRGMLKELDPYTVFIDEKRQDDIDLITKGKYGGIGITVGIRGENVLILEVMEGYSAMKQGILPGDALFEVSGKRVAPSNYDDISKLVKGPPGTFVDLKVLRGEPADTVSFTLLREEIIIRNVTYAGFVPENSNNIYIKLSGFTRTAGEELRTEINKLSAMKPVGSVVLDLRGNPGGLLDMAIDVSNKFLPKGELIVSTKGRDTASIRKFFAEQEPLLRDIPMVVLIDTGSASASEIVAGALQDNDRAVIAGERSFGKGLVQTVTSLSYNTSLKITTSRYYTPSGRSIQKVDYATSNKVIGKHDSVLTAGFSTKNGRLVYSGGGVAPDTIIADTEKPGIIKDLLARGLIFEFVNLYHEKNKGIDFEKIDRSALFTGFKEFLSKKKYSFTHPGAKQLKEAAESFGRDKNYVHLQTRINSLTEELETLSRSLLDSHREETVAELLAELSARYHNNNYRIRYKLNSDIQFKTALEIINDQKLYRKILAIR